MTTNRPTNPANSSNPVVSAADEGLWQFERSSDWVARYGACSNKATRTAPLNIDTNNISPCNALCRLNIQYNPTTCSVSMINNVPTVTFSPNCILKFKNDFFYLRKMTLHRHSMHTVNEVYYDMEVLLYHNRNPVNDADGGVILCILLKKGADYGTANEFLNEFINQMPANSAKVEKDIAVSDSWNPQQLLPDSKSFFYYDGALPYPPCTPKWSLIVFEEAVGVAQNIIDTMGYILGGDANNLNPNVRPIQRKPKGTVIFYNANSKFDSSQDMSEAESITAQPTLPTTPSVTGVSWLKQNIYYIKGIVITLILVLMIYVAIKFASIIVKNDILNSFIIRQLKRRETRQQSQAQAQMAEQQAMEMGGVAPVQATNLPNNNNNNNDN
jgi:carbonic anhydrase